MEAYIPLVLIIGKIAIAALILIWLVRSVIRTVSQGTVSVVESFGKYSRVLQPGLNFLIPIVERISNTITVQNRSSDLQFEAITKDQANVHFSAMIIFSALDASEETIKKIAYKFASEAQFNTALVRNIEASVRSLVAEKMQSEILGLRVEIVNHVKSHVDAILHEWGYALADVQINDIKFNTEITSSMERVVAAKNAKIAAENEGEALKIKETKAAEANAAAAKINAQGIADSRTILNESLKDLDPKIIAMMNLDKYCDTLRDIAREGEGKIIFVDTSGSEMNKLIANMGIQD